MADNLNLCHPVRTHTQTQTHSHDWSLLKIPDVNKQNRWIRKS